jgi:hypothetical protein
MITAERKPPIEKITLRFQTFQRKPQVCNRKKRLGGSVLFVYTYRSMSAEGTVSFYVLPRLLRACVGRDCGGALFLL